jgi:uncharacterized membrane protein
MAAGWFGVSSRRQPALSQWCSVGDDAGNVPLNDALAQVEPSSVEGAQLWTRYLADWAKWNHVRTLAGLLAAALFIIRLRH